MKPKKMMKLGIPEGLPLRIAKTCIESAKNCGMASGEIDDLLKDLRKRPRPYLKDPNFKELAKAIIDTNHPDPEIKPRKHGENMAPWKQWGENLEHDAIEQMRNACSLPVSVVGALMPDAHSGYGLPIGGVLAVKNAVIPFGVGMDIACRMKLSILDLPIEELKNNQDRFIKAIDSETRFGVGASFRKRRQHDVMDEDWNFSQLTKRLKDKAWEQLGTSGSGNHFVEFGILHLKSGEMGLSPGEYLAFLSHSGSRGTGAEIATYYSKLASQRHPELPRHLSKLAWLDLDSADGQTYWKSMELMGKYAAANHELIHGYVAEHLGVRIMGGVENHHNFAWKERFGNEDLIIHRKGATPAGEGILGMIPGSMADPGYVIVGRGNPESLNSASHGAGRLMSRTEAKKRYKWSDALKILDSKGIRVLSAGIDEVPMAYKDIDMVMAAQEDLVSIVARFDPKLVKMD